MEESGPEGEFKNFDKNKLWPLIYHKIREESMYTDLSFKDSKLPEYRSRNRYRDVCPYDHSRIHLERNDIDYINANLVEAPPANRQYILTQGPTESTSGHLWLMVWEQNSHAVVMLNRCMEGLRLKCHQYYPAGGIMDDADEVTFDDVHLKVAYISEENCDYYIVRTLLITDLLSGDSREVLQFHYITWPDFGVPESPGAFLDFLMAVRASGALSNRVGPPVIHCSAGIGRSGTFCLVDTCLVLIEQSMDMESISVIEILMDMRRYRSGLIQTPDQLRFSYIAIIEGAKRVLNTATPDSGFQDRLSSLSNSNGINGDNFEDEEVDSDDSSDDNIPSEPPPPPPRPLITRPKTANANRGRTPPSAAYLINNHNSSALEESSSSSQNSQVNAMASGTAAGNGLEKVVNNEDFGMIEFEEDENEEVEHKLEEDEFEKLKSRGLEVRRRNRDERKKHIAAQIEAKKKKVPTATLR